MNGDILNLSASQLLEIATIQLGQNQIDSIVPVLSYGADGNFHWTWSGPTPQQWGIYAVIVNKFPAGPDDEYSGDARISDGDWTGYNSYWVVCGITQDPVTQAYSQVTPRSNQVFVL